MGVVYYANYLRYFEAARAAFLRAKGGSHRDLDAWGVALPVAEAHCKYHRPARYEDVLEVDARVTELRGASLRFDYAIRRDGELLVTGYTVHACVDAGGRPRRIPGPLRDLIGPVPSE
ncbi:MAG: acyl-CoA thioesterase [Deltaproteobacteria bacterium]|nr:MAG: acyl-CoA thioesterase [Deltaproteobacteria bacterium]